MIFKFIILLLVFSRSVGKNYYFYVDIRWDDVEKYKNDSTLTVPYDHGLRILPALHVAKENLETLSLWSGSAKKESLPDLRISQYGNFYASALGSKVSSEHKSFLNPKSTEYDKIYHPLGFCGNLNGESGADDCLYHSAYDIGYCGISPGNICSNKPKKDHVFAFVKNDKDKESISWRIIEEEDEIHLILPDGSGLPNETAFKEKFGLPVPKKFTIPEMLERLEFMHKELEGGLSGIVGSTNQAYYTAFVAFYLNIPNIVAQVNNKDCKLEHF